MTFSLHKLLYLSMVMLACGQNPNAHTTSVTNGDLALGFVPITSGGAQQRNRLLVCKYLPEYNADMFVDSGICRSALLTTDGKEVDLIRSKFSTTFHSSQDGVEHLAAATEIRLIDKSPLLRSIELRSHEYRQIAAVVASLFIITIPIMIPLYFISRAKAKKARWPSDEAKAIGDTSQRTLPSPAYTGTSYSYYHSAYYHSDKITNTHWNNIFATDFHNMTSLERKGDLRTILVSIANFLHLKVNEDALKLH